MRVDVITLFPQIFDSWLGQGVVSRAIERSLVQVCRVPLREFGVGRHKITDDYPFGGGPGMVLKPEPVFAALASLHLNTEVPVILLSPQGERFTQHTARRLSHLSHLVLIAGHYEGVDERIRQQAITGEVSIGDYVISCGELAAMVLVDAVVRLVPGVLTTGSTDEESFQQDLLEYPQYTRPAIYNDWSVPEVLRSGNHEQIATWRRRQSLRRTFERRPDLLSRAALSTEELLAMEEWAREGAPDVGD